MKILIDDIPESGLALDLEEAGAAFEEAAGGKLDFSFAAPVKAHFDLSRKGRSLFVAGDIKTSVHLACSRCLKEYDLPFATDFATYYETGSVSEKEKELKPSEIDVNYLVGDELDTTDILLGQMSLELPMQPLCTPECKGLCPRCGADLNLGECGCGGQEKAGTRFAKLKDFKAR